MIPISFSMISSNVCVNVICLIVYIKENTSHPPVGDKSEEWVAGRVTRLVARAGRQGGSLATHPDTHTQTHTNIQTHRESDAAAPPTPILLFLSL